MDGPRHPRAGEWVYLLDPRGCGCLGHVESIDGWLARIKPDWESWSGGGKPPPQARVVSSQKNGVEGSRALDPGLPS
jgi:hypothetical protein